MSCVFISYVSVRDTERVSRILAIADRLMTVVSRIATLLVKVAIMHYGICLWIM
jgi:hypothetical protein